MWGQSPGLAQSETGKPVTLESLLDEAARENPRIKAAQSEWESSENLITARKAFPDPQLSYTYFVESIETRVGPQKNIVGLKQTFPFYGKRGLRGEIQAQEAEAKKQRYEAVVSEVMHQVKKRYYDLFYVAKAIEVTTREKDVLQYFEEISRAKYETGSGIQQNILKAQVEISKLNERLLELEQNKETVEASLNALLDRPAYARLGNIAQPEYRELYYYERDLLVLARENRQEIKAASSLVERSRKSYQLAKKDYFPDITLGANYFQIDKGPLDVSDNGQDAFNLVLSFNIPIWQNKLSSQVNSALSDMRSRESERQELLNQTEFEVRDAYAKINTAKETMLLYRNALIPQAEQSLKSAEAGYMTGIVSFLDLLDAERILLRSQLAYWRSYADYLKYIADMERAVGAELGKPVSEERFEGPREE